MIQLINNYDKNLKTKKKPAELNFVYYLFFSKNDIKMRDTDLVCICPECLYCFLIGGLIFIIKDF